MSRGILTHQRRVTSFDLTQSRELRSVVMTTECNVTLAGPRVYFDTSAIFAQATTAG